MADNGDKDDASGDAGKATAPSAMSQDGVNLRAISQDSILPKYAGWMGIGLVGLGAVGYIATFLSGSSSAASLGFAAISGVTLLSVSLYGLIVLTRSIGMADPTQALALPNGSVRALLALVLAIVFVAVASWTLGGMLDPKGPLVFQSEIKHAEHGDLLKTYPPERYIIATVEKGDLESDQIYVRRDSPDHDVMDIAKQLVTISATVLVTIVGFYFGSKSAADAVRSARDNLAVVRQALVAGSAGQGAAGAVQNASQPPPTADDVAKTANAIAAMASSTQTKMDSLGSAPLNLLHVAADGRDDVKDQLATAVKSFSAMQDNCKACGDLAEQAKAFASLPLGADTLAVQDADDKLQKLNDQASQANHDFAQAYSAFTTARDAILKLTAKG